MTDPNVKELVEAVNALETAAADYECASLRGIGNEATVAFDALKQSRTHLLACIDSQQRTIEGLRKELASEKALNATNYWTDVEMNLQQNQKITDKDREAMLAIIKQLFDNKTSALSQSSQAGEEQP